MTETAQSAVPSSWHTLVEWLKGSAPFVKAIELAGDDGLKLLHERRDGARAFSTNEQMEMIGREGLVVDANAPAVGRPRQR